ncbi:MAG: chromate transporter [Betaproteobacteria bacterium]|nr:MAG: chromate transporter [Betaproteobacteria bacterium]TMH67063.1 MAG: chromate transporter [Betaproteobacteria bacterium]
MRAGACGGGSARTPVDMGPEQPEPLPPSPVSRATLFAAFLKIGMLGFGGVMPWARRVLVEERGWLSDREFAELIGMCQVLPGPNVVNLSVILGARWQGAIGSLLALTGILFVPVIAVIVLATFYASVAHSPIARSAIGGASAAAAGLIIGTAFRLIVGARPPMRAVLLAVAVFIAVGIAQAPLLWVLAVAVPFAIAVEWRAAP